MEDNFCPNLGTRHPKFGKQFGPKSDPILGNKIMVGLSYVILKCGNEQIVVPRKSQCCTTCWWRQNDV